MKNVFNAIQTRIFFAIRKRKLIKNNVIDFVELLSSFMFIWRPVLNTC